MSIPIPRWVRVGGREIVWTGIDSVKVMNATERDWHPVHPEKDQNFPENRKPPPLTGQTLIHQITSIQFTPFHHQFPDSPRTPDNIHYDRVVTQSKVETKLLSQESSFPGNSALLEQTRRLRMIQGDFFPEMLLSYLFPL